MFDAQSDCWGPTDVEGVDGEDRNTWRAERERPVGHAEGDFSDVDRSQRVVETIEEE